MTATYAQMEAMAVIGAEIALEREKLYAGTRQNSSPIAISVTIIVSASKRLLIGLYIAR